MQEEYIPVQLKQQGGGSFMYELSSRIFLLYYKAA
jgi:hypothetical protein